MQDRLQTSCHWWLFLLIRIQCNCSPCNSQPCQSIHIFQTQTLKLVVFKTIPRIRTFSFLWTLSIPFEICLGWMSPHWCLVTTNSSYGATSHCPSQCWHRIMSLYRAVWPQWLKCFVLDNGIITTYVGAKPSPVSMLTQNHVTTWRRYATML